MSGQVGVKVAFALVFPGQGSQSVGMMQPYLELAQVRATFEEASSVLGLDLWGMVDNGPAEELNRTVNTQPVMLVAGVALLRAWRACGGQEPAAVAGHSLGEYSALVAAGALEFADALRLVQYRARSMQEAVPEGTGGIAAVLGLDDDIIRAVCAEAAQGDVLDAANFNAPGQVVIAGHRQAVERGMAAAKARGAKRALMLPMSAPSHCSLMRPASEQVRVRLAAVPLQPPRIVLINNVDVQAPTDPEVIRDSLVRQMHAPVRWVEVVRALAARGVTHLIECGPGGVLTALNKRIAPEVQAVSIKDAAHLHQLATTTQ
ncbi:MAG: ACP S-malonyltransferase [Burkholderiales bacterium]|nr:ACP S-malonyltransferase [Burkholderiales bacterium]